MMTYYPYGYADLQDLLYYLQQPLESLGKLSFVNMAFIVFKIVVAYLVLEKAGERGWKSLIPVYKHYIEYKLYWSTAMFWFSFAIPIAIVVLVIVAIALYRQIILVVVIAVVACILLFASFALNIILQIKKGVCFGETKLFGLGLILLNTIFNAIIAFDSKCQYRVVVQDDINKPETENKEENQTENKEENITENKEETEA